MKGIIFTADFPVLTWIIYTKREGIIDNGRRSYMFYTRGEAIQDLKAELRDMHPEVETIRIDAKYRYYYGRLGL